MRYLMAFHKQTTLTTNGSSSTTNGHQTNGHRLTIGKSDEEIYRRIVMLTMIGYVCTLLTIFILINEEVSDEYMDEIFHAEQARAYCVGNFTQWNSKITTPPGLYLTTLGFSKPFSELYAFGEEDARKICPTFMLRFINLVFAVANAYIMYLIGLQTFKNNTKTPKLNLLISTFSLATFPPLFFFTFLYYTDSGSTFFVLLMYLYHINNQEWLGALFGAISLLYRQTNIVWMFFLASHTSLKIITKYIEKSKKKAKTGQILRMTSVEIAKTCGGYAIVGLLFVVFLVINKGIVVGDRSAHQAAFNVPQIFYFLGFLSISGFMWLYTISNVRDFVSFLVRNKYKTALLMIVMALVIDRLTYIHPYLLADNRHYTFYIWRRVFGRPGIFPYLCLPFYLYAAFAAYNCIRAKDPIWKTLYAICVCVTIVPQQLLEFRYFLMPYIFWRLNLTTTTTTVQHIVEFLLNTAINALTLYMFLYKPFKWSHSSDVQRFMW